MRDYRRELLRGLSVLNQWKEERIPNASLAEVLGDDEEEDGNRHGRNDE